MLMDADRRIRPAIKVGFRILGATSARDHTIANNMTSTGTPGMGGRPENKKSDQEWGGDKSAARDQPVMLSKERTICGGSLQRKREFAWK